MFTAFLFALSLTTTANALVVMSVSPLLTALFAQHVPEGSGAAAHLARRAAPRRSASRGCSALRWKRTTVGMAIAFADPGGRGDQRRGAARERGEARPGARRDARRRALVPDRPALRLAFFRHAEETSRCSPSSACFSSACRACCWCSRAARCSRPRSRCSACWKWCWGRCGRGSARARYPRLGTLLGGAIVLAALARERAAPRWQRGPRLASPRRRAQPSPMPRSCFLRAWRHAHRLRFTRRWNAGAPGRADRHRSGWRRSCADVDHARRPFRQRSNSRQLATAPWARGKASLSHGRGQRSEQDRYEVQSERHDGGRLVASETLAPRWRSPQRTAAESMRPLAAPT